MAPLLGKRDQGRSGVANPPTRSEDRAAVSVMPDARALGAGQRKKEAVPFAQTLTLHNRSAEFLCGMFGRVARAGSERRSHTTIRHAAAHANESTAIQLQVRSGRRTSHPHGKNSLG